MTSEPATAPLDPPGARDRSGRRLALRLWGGSILFWGLLGIPFSWALWSVNEEQFRRGMIYYGWGVPVIGWTGAVLLPWWLWRRQEGGARAPEQVGIAVFLTSCALYLVGALALFQLAAFPPLEAFKVAIQGPLLGALFALAAGLRAASERQGSPDLGILRRHLPSVLTLLVLGVALPLAVLGLAHKQTAVERERGALLQEALEDGVRAGTPLPDLSSFGDFTFARVIDRATGTIRLGPDAGASLDSLELDHPGVIMTGRAGWFVSRTGEHRVVAHLPVALPDDPGVILLAVSPLADYAAPLWSTVAVVLALLLIAAGIVIPLARRLATLLDG